MLQDAHHPLEEFQKHTLKCAQDAFSRISLKVNDPCPLDSLEYNEQFTVITYYYSVEMGLKESAEEKAGLLISKLDEVKVQDGSQSISLMYMNTLILQILMNISQENQISGETLCVNSPNNQLCREFNQIQDLVTKKGKAVGLLTGSSTPEERLVFYNVMLYMESVELDYFETIASLTRNHEQHNEAIDLRNLLKIGQQVDYWIPSWMKVNYSDINPIFELYRTNFADIFTQSATTQDADVMKFLSFGD